MANDFKWTEELVNDLLSFIHDNEGMNLLFSRKAFLEDPDIPVNGFIIEKFKEAKQKNP